MESIQPLRNSTLLFLIKKSSSEITDICLAMKKRGFGAGRYNGTGGKVREGESIEAALVRETEEEVGVTPHNVIKVAELIFTFPHKPLFDQMVHVYLTDTWTGEPAESEEMYPQWFKVSDIPYETMWSDDILWLPHVIEGKLLKGSFTFTEDEKVLASDREFIKNFGKEVIPE